MAINNYYSMVVQEGQHQTIITNMQLCNHTETIKIVQMSDGSYITWRKTSSSDGTPAIDINPQSSSSTYAKQKIHFVA